MDKKPVLVVDENFEVVETIKIGPFKKTETKELKIQEIKPMSHTFLLPNCFSSFHK